MDHDDFAWPFELLVHAFLPITSSPSERFTEQLTFFFLTSRLFVADSNPMTRCYICGRCSSVCFE